MFIVVSVANRKAFTQVISDALRRYTHYKVPGIIRSINYKLNAEKPLKRSRMCTPCFAHDLCSCFACSSQCAIVCRNAVNLLILVRNRGVFREVVTGDLRSSGV